MSMGSARRAPTVILITDPRWPLRRVVEVIEKAASVLGGAALLVQLRDKAADTEALWSSARVLREVTSRWSVSFTVNAPTPAALRVALEVAADGAHVPNDAIERARSSFGERAWVSAPAHADEEVARAARSGATAVLVSPIWETPGKGPARGATAIRSARATVSTSGAASTLVYALGGVDELRAAACAEAGAHGVAVMRALLDASDPGAAARLLGAPFLSRSPAVSGTPPPVAGRGSGV